MGLIALCGKTPPRRVKHVAHVSAVVQPGMLMELGIGLLLNEYPPGFTFVSVLRSFEKLPPR